MIYLSPKAKVNDRDACFYYYKNRSTVDLYLYFNHEQLNSKHFNRLGYNKLSKLQL